MDINRKMFLRFWLHYLILDQAAIYYHHTPSRYIHSGFTVPLISKASKTLGNSITP